MNEIQEDLILIKPKTYEKANILLEKGNLTIPLKDYDQYKILLNNYYFYERNLLQLSPLIIQHLNDVYLSQYDHIKIKTNYDFNFNNNVNLIITRKFLEFDSLKTYKITLKPSEIESFLLSLIINYNYIDEITVKTITR